MEEFKITRNQFLKLQEIFTDYPRVESVIWQQKSTSGIGYKITLIYDPRSVVKVDITDYESW